MNEQAQDQEQALKQLLIDKYSARQCKVGWETKAGSTYVSLTSGGIKPECNEYPSTESTPGLAISRFLEQVEKLAKPGHVLLIRYWPRIVEFTPENDSSEKHYSVYSRLVFE